MTKLRYLRRAAARSRLAPLLALPTRAMIAFRLLWSSGVALMYWLVRSREHTNFTYDLTPLNREHLAWFVADVCNLPVNDVRGYIKELLEDDVLLRHIREQTLSSSRRGLADVGARYGRRLGWYAIVRATRPSHVVETGTDKGLGSCVLASALLRNGGGTLTTIDVDPDAGYLIAGSYASVTQVVNDDSLRALDVLNAPIDVFIQDSDHSDAHEAAEFLAIEPLLAHGAIVISDNAHTTYELLRWAERTGRVFKFFCEKPAGHWYPGSGIGVAIERHN